MTQKRVWYIALIGRPNVGKSTFINTLIGEKVSIISSIPQTTRKRVLAIYNDDDSQIIFFDTPWIHQHQKDFNKHINAEAISSLKQADGVLYFIDSSRSYGEEERYIEEVLQLVSTPIIQVYTKSDLMPADLLIRWENTFSISSVTQDGFEELIWKLKDILPIWHPFYPDDYYTDQDIYFRISEIVREKVFLYTKEEVPHSIYVEIWELDDTESLLKIQAYIYTEAESQKKIIIGKRAELLTKIGTQSRQELENIFWKKIFLSLRVKVMEKWRKNEKIIKNILK